MPYKDGEMARKKAGEIYLKIKSDPEKLEKRRKYQREYMRKWRKEHPERYREIVRRSAKKNYDREKNSKYVREWRKKNPYNYEKYRQKEKDRKEQQRLNAIKELGGKCVNCGCDDVVVLEGHHINGRKKDVYSNYWWGHLDETKDLIELLCANCHVKKHREERKKI